MTILRRHLRGWGYPLLMVLMAVGIAIEAAFLVPVIKTQSEQSRQGQLARERQMRVFPVSCKLYIDAKRRDVITAAELRVFETPRRCPR